jgi:NADPH:quinone reductase-like Zn-dependent oxidoreductase
MENAFRFYEPGGPDVMRWEEVSPGEPGPGEARVRHVAVGLNFADTYCLYGRSGGARRTVRGIVRQCRGRKTAGSSVFVV